MGPYALGTDLALVDNACLKNPLLWIFFLPLGEKFISVRTGLGGL
jgi:hypothetical protein